MGAVADGTPPGGAAARARRDPRTSRRLAASDAGDRQGGDALHGGGGLRGAPLRQRRARLHVAPRGARDARAAVRGARRRARREQPVRSAPAAGPLARPGALQPGGQLPRRSRRRQPAAQERRLPRALRRGPPAVHRRGAGEAGALDPLRGPSAALPHRDGARRAAPLRRGCLRRHNPRTASIPRALRSTMSTHDCL